LVSSQRWHENAAAALARRLDGIVAEVVSELRVRVPEYERALVAAGEDVRTVCEGTVGLLLGSLVSREALIASGSSVRKVGQARCEAGVVMDTLLEAIAVQRDLLGRRLEEEAARTGAADADLRAADRRLEQATTALIGSLTQGYMDAIRERGQRQRATAEAMVRVAAAVNQSLELAEVAQSALAVVKEVLGADAALLWLAIEGGGPPALTYTTGLLWNEDGRLRSLDGPGGFPLLRRALGSARAVTGSGLEAGRRPVLASAVAVALRSRGEVLGILVAGCRSERAFDASDLAFASGSADHLAAALARAEQHRREARTDHLTGLANRKEFERQLERAVAAAQRHGRPLALALVDLDGLKEVNDRLGHAAGDRALRSVGRALQLGVRAADTCARIGGDEFAVAMPDTTEEQAAEVMRRVCEAIREGGLDVSTGVAAWSPGLRPLQLFKRADAGLYQDKRRHHRGREGTD
jgi:diguanylate cyclase (GGDEF)-like protein